MRYTAVAGQIQKNGRAHGRWNCFFLLADSKLLDSQKNVLVSALGKEGMTCTWVCREISTETGQDVSTVRKTFKFFREVGFLDCGTRNSKGKKTTLTAAGKALARMFMRRVP